MSDLDAGRLDGAQARSVTRWLSPLTVALGAGLLATGYLLDAPEPWAASSAAVPVVLWLVARARQRAFAADASLAAFIALAGLGLWLGVGSGWMIPAAVAGLVAWDLARLEQRLAATGHVQDRRALEARHLVLLLPVALAGLALAMLGAGVRITLGFLPALLLGVLAVGGLAQTVAYLRRKQD